KQKTHEAWRGPRVFDAFLHGLEFKCRLRGIERRDDFAHRFLERFGRERRAQQNYKSVRRRLRHWQIRLWQRSSFIEAVNLQMRNNANNRSHFSSTLIDLHPNALSDCVLSWKITLSQLLVDDDEGRRVL